MAITKLSDISGEYPDFYADTLFVAREMNLLSALVTAYGGSGFAVRKVPIYPQLSAQVKAEGVPLNNPQTFGQSTKATFTPYTVMAQAVLTDE